MHNFFFHVHIHTTAVFLLWHNFFFHRFSHNFQQTNGQTCVFHGFSNNYRRFLTFLNNFFHNFSHFFHRVSCTEQEEKSSQFLSTFHLYSQNGTHWNTFRLRRCEQPVFHKEQQNTHFSPLSSWNFPYTVHTKTQTHTNTYTSH